MESHPYTKTRGVGPVTTQLTPGAEPAPRPYVGGFRAAVGDCAPLRKGREKDERNALNVKKNCAA